MILTSFDYNENNDAKSEQTIAVTLKETVSTYSGKICTVRFKIAENAKPGMYTVGVNMPSKVTYHTDVLSSVVIPATVKVTHDTTFVPAKEANCSTPGNLDYYICKTCERYYADEFCTQEMEGQFKDIVNGDHVLNGVYEHDSNSHWQVCQACSRLIGMTGHTDADGQWEVDTANGTHYHTCICGEAFDIQVHTGGKATCHALAECTVCQTRYGVTNTANHVGPYQMHGSITEPTHTTTGLIPATVCTACKGEISEAVVIPALTAHTDTEGTWKSDGTYHWLTCACGERIDGEGKLTDGIPHTGGTATCAKQAKCTVCGEFYGELRSTHGKTAIRGAVPATCQTPGKTGEKYCLTCGTVLEGSTPVSANVHASLDGKWYEEDGKHYQICAGCNERIREEVHSGGMATCKAKAVCTVCKVAYGEVSPTLHTGPFEIRNGVTVTCAHDGYTGDTFCLGCNQTSAQGEVQKATGKHTDADGGKWDGDDTHHWYTCGCGEKFNITPHKEGTSANCRDKAICEICNLSYGKTDSKTHVGTSELREAEAASCTENGKTGDRYCLTCNGLIRKGTTIKSPGTHKDADGIWSSGEKNHWYVCTCGTIFNRIPHTFAPVRDAEYHWQECTVCGFVTEKAEHTAGDTTAYFRDAKGHSAVCDTCGEVMGYTDHVETAQDGVCDICSYQTMTLVEMQLKAAEMAEEDTEETITATDRITAILDLKEKVENATEVHETLQTKIKETVNSLLQKVDAIGVDTPVHDNSEEATDTVKLADPESMAALLQNITANDAGQLSQAMREAEEKVNDGKTAEMPMLVFSIKQEMVYDTDEGKVLADEHAMAYGEESVTTSLDVLAQVDISVEKKLMVGDSVKYTDTVTELEREITICIPIPEGLERVVDLFLLQTHQYADGTYVTRILQDLDNNPDTFTIKTDRFSVCSFCTEVPVTIGLEVTATKTTDTVTVTAIPENISSANLVIAIYHGNGKMYAVDVQAINQGTTEIQVDFAYEDGAYVRAYLLNDKSIPLQAAIDINMQD